MSAGDFHIRRNNADTSAVPNAGSGNEDAAWDTLVYENGSIVSYTDPNLQLDTGLYLIFYSEHFYTADVTNNERIEIQGEIHVSGTGAVGGFGQDYIRKSSSQQSCVVQGSMYLQVTSDNTDVFVRFYRTDNSTTGTVSRVPGHGGITVVEMDDSSHNFGFYSTSASEQTSGTTERTLNINTNDKQDTGFSRSSAVVTVTNARRYLVTYSMDVSQTATGREVVTAYLRKNGTTEIIGTRGYCYVRGSDGTQDGAVTWIGIVDLAASDTVEVRWSCPTSATITAAAGGTLQMWELPTTADTAIMEATTGDYNADADFEWDTLPHIDTASFTATAGNANIDVDQRDHALVFATFAQVTDSTPQRAYPLITIEDNGNAVNWAEGGAYHRNSSTSNFSVSVAGMLHNLGADVPITIHTLPYPVTGALANTKGQFSVLSLESIWTYTYEPVITDCEDEQINIGETNIVILGDSFESSQGTGKVELGSAADYTGTKVVQTIDSWADGSIQFDSVQGALDEGPVWVFVTTDGGKRTSGYPVNLGEGSYFVVVEATSPDHFWRFDNDYLDTGTVTGLVADNAQDGNPSFETTPICRSATYSLVLDGDDSTSPANSTRMNSATQTRRVMGGWFMIEGIQQALACIYEEGAQINNYCYILGLGNKLLCQAVDDGGYNIQVYGEKPLLPGRPYHLCWEFSGSAYQNIFRLYVDGVLQSRSFGNPPGLTTFPSHTGNIEFGGTGTTLEVGGTDITFAFIEDGHYNAWGTWVDGAVPNATTIKESLFQAGAPEKNNIASGTEAAMQTALEAFDDTTHVDWPLTYKISPATDETNPTFTLTNQIFHEDTTLHIKWMGGGLLTIRNSGTSNFDTSKVYLAGGGTVAVIETAPVAITVRDINTKAVVSGAYVLLEADTGGDLTVGTDLINGATNGSGQVTAEIDYTSNQPVTGKVRQGTSSPYYQQTNIAGTVTAAGLDLTVFVIPDE